MHCFGFIGSYSFCTFHPMQSNNKQKSYGILQVVALIFLQFFSSSEYFFFPPLAHFKLFTVLATPPPQKKKKYVPPLILGNFRKKFGNIGSAVCYTIYTIYLSLRAQTTETKLSEPFFEKSPVEKRFKLRMAK